MTQTSTFPAITEDLLQEVVRRIRSAGNPVKIVLFGSHGRGEARPDSDLDLLIIEESDLPRYERCTPYRMALMDLLPEKDIVVWTPSEVKEWAQVPNAFITTIIFEGRVLYERSA